MGENHGMNFKHFPNMLLMTDNVFDLKKFESRSGYQCRNVTTGVAATIDSYSHLHTEYALHQGLRKNKLDGSWNVVPAPLQFVYVDMSTIVVDTGRGERARLLIREGR